MPTPRKIFVLEIPDKLSPAEIAKVQAAVKQKLTEFGHRDFEVMVFDGGWRFRRLAMDEEIEGDVEPVLGDDDRARVYGATGAMALLTE